MWTFLIIALIIFAIITIWMFHCGKDGYFCLFLIIWPIVLFAILSGQSNTLIDDAKPYDFYVEGVVRRIYFDAEEEKYFALFSNDLNPIKIFRKEYLNTEQVECFLSAYKEYEKLGDELRENDIFATN